MINIPDDKYFTPVRDTVFVSPRDRYYKDMAFTLGGEELNTPNRDQNTHVWKGWIDPEERAFFVQREDLTQKHKIVSLEPTDEFDFTFDQNMQPVVVWRVNNETYLYSYQETQFTVTELGENLYTPRIELDHKLRKDIPNSDIILAYTYDGKLCVRIQREKYRKEHIVAENPVKSYLIKIGRTVSGEFGFQWV